MEGAGVVERAGDGEWLEKAELERRAGWLKRAGEKEKNGLKVGL